MKYPISRAFPVLCICTLGTLASALPAHAQRDAAPPSDRPGYARPDDDRRYDDRDDRSNDDRRYEYDRRDADPRDADPRYDDRRNDDPRSGDPRRNEGRRKAGDNESKGSPRDRLLERTARLQMRLRNAGRAGDAPELRALQARVRRVQSFLHTHPNVSREDYTRQDRELRDVSGALRDRPGDRPGARRPDDRDGGPDNRYNDRDSRVPADRNDDRDAPRNDRRPSDRDPQDDRDRR